MEDEYLFPEGYAEEALREWRGGGSVGDTALDLAVKKACLRAAVETLAWAAKSWDEGSDVNATLLDIADSLEMTAEERRGS